MDILTTTNTWKGGIKVHILLTTPESKVKYIEFDPSYGGKYYVCIRYKDGSSIAILAPIDELSLVAETITKIVQDIKAGTKGTITRHFFTEEYNLTQRERGENDVGAHLGVE